MDFSQLIRTFFGILYPLITVSSIIIRPTPIDTGRKRKDSFTATFKYRDLAKTFEVT